MNPDAFLRSVLFGEAEFNPLKFCHSPIIIRDSKTSLGEAIARLKVYPERLGDDVIDEDIIVFWGDEQRRVITGSDALGRLLRGIVQQEKTVYRKIKYGAA
ncbi:MAG: hypothetical protein KAV87_21950 [Desulfobacteraceae bacterium]|nr:hypothetical protein [Desulfobacteraceae bacterium]